MGGGGGHVAKLMLINLHTVSCVHFLLHDDQHQIHSTKNILTA